MAAVLRPQQSTRPHLVQVGAPSTTAAAPAAPRLVVIEGGRSAAGRSRRLTFLRRRLVVVAAVALGLWGVAGALGPADGPVPRLPAVHVVQPGATLLGSAASLPGAADVRVLVSELADANGGPGVRAGQELVIPAELARIGR